MKLIVQTQYRENYGYRWKNKGGDNYVATIEPIVPAQEVVSLQDALAALAAEVTKEVEYRNDMATNEVIGWYVMGDNEPYLSEWYDVTIMMKVDGKWTRKNERVEEELVH